MQKRANIVVEQVKCMQAHKVRMKTKVGVDESSCFWAGLERNLYQDVDLYSNKHLPWLIKFQNWMWGTQRDKRWHCEVVDFWLHPHDILNTVLGTVCVRSMVVIYSVGRTISQPSFQTNPFKLEAWTSRAFPVFCTMGFMHIKADIAIPLMMPIHFHKDEQHNETPFPATLVTRHLD